MHRGMALVGGGAGRRPPVHGWVRKCRHSARRSL